MTSALALLGGAAGFALGGPAGAAIGAGIGGGIDRNETAQAMANSAQDFSAQQYATRYQTQVKDMQAAGLNPMLAYMQAPGPSPQGVTYNPVNAFERTASDYNSAYNVERTGQNIEADTGSKLANTRLTEKEIAIRDETIGLVRAQASKIASEIDKLTKESENISADTKVKLADELRLRSVIENLAASTALMNEQKLNEVEKRNVLQATAAKLASEALISKAEYEAMEKTGFIGVLARELKVTSDIGSEWIDKLLPWKSLFSREQQAILDRESRERIASNRRKLR